MAARHLGIGPMTRPNLSPFTSDQAEQSDEGQS